MQASAVGTFNTHGMAKQADTSATDSLRLPMRCPHAATTMVRCCFSLLSTSSRSQIVPGGSALSPIGIAGSAPARHLLMLLPHGDAASPWGEAGFCQRRSLSEEGGQICNRISQRHLDLPSHLATSLLHAAALAASSVSRASSMI